MKRLMTWMFIFAIAIGASLWVNPDLPADIGLVESDLDHLMSAWEQRQSNLIVEVDARVVLVLPTFEDVATQFQRFRVELENGHTLIVSHDLDLAMAVPIDVGSEVRLRGEYDWTAQGGMIHWTHEDPSGQREGGWIEHLGRIYR